MSDAAEDLRTVGQVDRQRLSVWLRLLKVTRQMEARIRENLRVEFDTTLPRFDVLAALYRTGDGLKMSELSAALRVSNGNVTGIVERLVLDGLVVRVPVHGDRRAMMVRLSDGGRRKFTRMADAHIGWISSMLGSLGDDETGRLIGLLDEVSFSRETT